MFSRQLRPWLSVFAVLLVIGLVASPAEAKKKDDNAQPKPREVYFSSDEEIPPRLAYMRDVMDSAGLIGYIRNTISSILAEKRYIPKNYKLVSNRIEYKGKYYFLEVETEVEIEKPDRRTFKFEVKTKGTLYESKGGKKVKRFKGKAKNTVQDRFRAGLLETVKEAFEPMKDKIPYYDEF